MNPMSPLSNQSLHDADWFFNAGQLDEAVQAQTEAVKKDPSCNEKRLFLFELLTFSGDLHRAELQIEAVNYADTEVDAAVQPYRNLLAAERIRRQVFEGKAKPQFVQEPPEHVRSRLRSLRCFSEGDVEHGFEYLAQANDACPSVAGELNGTPVDVVRDCDDVMGTVLEAMSSSGAYLWIPMSQIDSLSLTEPKTPRDLLWINGFLEMKGGASGPIFLPTLYPGTDAHEDRLVRLGRKTDWRNQPTEADDEHKTMRGIGLRTFLVGDDAMTMLDLHDVHFA